MSRTSRSVRAEYSAYIHIKHRCYNPKHKQFKDYGGRGITLHAAWIDDFWAFYDYVGPRPGPEYSIDRIDNDRGYEPGNLKWSTRREQQNNQRRNRRITCPRTGVTQTLSQWAEARGLSVPTLSGRLGMGWSVDKALYTQPLRAFEGRKTRHMITVDGVEMRIIAVARARGLCLATVYSRLHRGLSSEDALKPVTRR